MVLSLGCCQGCCVCAALALGRGGLQSGAFHILYFPLHRLLQHI